MTKQSYASDAVGCMALIFIFLLMGTIATLFTTTLIFFGWNAIMPGLFNLPKATFAQAFWLGIIISVVGSAFKIRVKTQ